MAKQLGGLISLLQGIDLAPMKLAQDRVLGQGQLAIQQETARASANLEKRRLDLAEISARENTATERERINLGREDLIARNKQADEQRGLDRELAAAQQAGRIDIQELVGAQELAHINLQGQLDQTRQQERAEFELAAQERLIASQGENLTKELDLRRELSDREFTLAKQRGDDDSAISALVREQETIKAAIMRRQQERLPQDEKSSDDLKALEMELARNQIKKSIYELEKLNPDSPAVKALQEAELRLTEATARKVEAEAGTEEQVGEAQKLQLDNAKKAGKEAPADSAGETDKTIKRLQDKIERGSSPVYGITGNETALKAVEHLTDIKDIEGEDYDELRAKLKRVAQLAEKGGSSKVSKYPFVSDARVIGKDLSKEEVSELEKLIDELYGEGIYVGYAD